MLKTERNQGKQPEKPKRKIERKNEEKKREMRRTGGPPQPSSPHVPCGHVATRGGTRLIIF